MRESTEQRKANAQLRERGYLVVRAGTGGRPDNLVVVAPRVHVWFEWKTDTGRLTPAQERVIPKMKQAGELVYFPTKAEDCLEWVEYWANVYSRSYLS
jgi:Holliday junction resolvase